MVWHRRELNVVADFLANYTMDSGRTWIKEFDWPFPGRSVESCNLVAHSDGGARAHSCSASAWIIEAGIVIDGQWTFKPIALARTYTSSYMSSFTAEAIALEECTRFLRILVSERSRCNCEKFG